MAESNNDDLLGSRYMATKADIARLEEQIKGLDRAIDLRLIGADRRLEERFSALDRRLEDRFTASEKAIGKAEEAQLRVNQSQNEFRGALQDQSKLAADQAKTLVTRAELDTIEKRVQFMEKDTVTRREQEQTDARIKSLERGESGDRERRIQALERGESGNQGRTGALGAFKDNLFAIIALLIALGSFYLTFTKAAQVDRNTGAIERQAAPK